MTEKMRAEAAHDGTVPNTNAFLSEQVKDCCFASGCVAALAMLAYSLVNIVLTNIRDPNQPDIEIVIGYILIILGYLLLPGVAVLLVRRKRCLARNRVLLMSESDIGDSQFTDAFGGRMLKRSIFGTRQLIRAVEAVTKVVIWGAADGKEEQCSVCLNEVDAGCEVRILRCNHVFHKECADLWLVNGRKNSCPMCMQRVCKDRGADMVPIER